MSNSPLVLLHGFGEDERIWQDFLPFLGPDYPTICPAYATWVDCASLAAFARKIVDELPAETQFVLVGHSMGGYIALEIAQQFPEKVKKVVMLHSTFAADSSEKKMNRDRTIDLLAKKGTSIFIGPFLPNLFAPSFSDATLLLELAHRYSSLPAAGLIAATRAMRDRQDFTSFIRETAIPFLFILGEQDALIPLESITRILTKSVVTLPNVGHQGTYEAPVACAEAIKKFIDV